MDDTISRQAAIAVADTTDCLGLTVEDVKMVTDEVVKGLKQLPSAQPTLYGYDIGTLKAIANTLTAKGLTPEVYADLITDTGRVVQMALEEQRETVRKVMEDIHGRLNQQTGGD